MDPSTVSMPLEKPRFSVFFFLEIGVPHLGQSRDLGLDDSLQWGAGTLGAELCSTTSPNAVSTTLSCDSQKRSQTLSMTLGEQNQPQLISVTQVIFFYRIKISLGLHVLFIQRRTS